MQWKITAVVLAAINTVALAADHSVNSDADLRQALAAARPGDVIRLAPGIYRGGIQARLAGEKDRPITLGSADPERPAVIEGGGGLQFTGARHLVVRDLIIRGATTNGLNIDDAGKLDHSAIDITIERCQVRETGPDGNRDGIKLSGLRDFRLRDCVVEGWGGSAVDMVGCLEGTIERCRFIGKAGFEQSNGVQMKGGTRAVSIRGCVFENAGSRAINAGGSTGMPYFRPQDATYEAKDLTIEQNVIRGSEAAVAFVGIDGGTFRRNTILYPKKWVFRILQETKAARFNRSRDVVFERNLIVYQRAAVRTVVNIGGETEPQSFKFAENWWYCADAPGGRPELPSPERDAVVGRDPQLKPERGEGGAWPTSTVAQGYGADPPAGPPVSR